MSPSRKRKDALPQMPIRILEQVLAAWNKSTAKKVTNEWLQQLSGCSQGSSRRYLSDLARMGLIDPDGKANALALACAAAPPEGRCKAFEAIAAACYPKEIEALERGELSSYEDLLLHLRQQGYRTKSAAGNIARLFCFIIERAGKQPPLHTK